MSLGFERREHSNEKKRKEISEDIILFLQGWIYLYLKLVMIE